MAFLVLEVPAAVLLLTFNITSQYTTFAGPPPVRHMRSISVLSSLQPEVAGDCLHARH